MTNDAVGALLLPYFAAAVFYQLPFVLAGWLAALRLPPNEREGLTGSLSLYAIGLLGLLASALLQQLEMSHGSAIARETAVVLLGLGCIRLGGLVLFRVLLPRLRVVPPRILEDLVVFAGYVVWAISRLSHAGVDLSSIVATSAVITGIVAFSLQDTLGNILGGMALQLETSIRVGDWIKVDDAVGRVVDIRWRSTVIETRNWETVVIPNSSLMKARFTILGRRGGHPLQWRRWIWFHVEVTIPPQRVIATVQTALRRAVIPNAAQQPPPNCILMDINEGLGRYAVRYWLTDLAADDPTDSDVRAHVVAALQRADIPLALPETRQRVIPDSESHEARRREAERAECARALRDVELFAGLSDAERKHLSEHMVRATFLAGETITHQGDVAHWLYVLDEGDARAVLQDDKGQRRVLAELRAGTKDSFFGEMGMLTGEPRANSVIAVTDVECYRLDKEGFEEILKARPAMAEEISTVMARRRADLASIHQALDAEQRRRMVEASHGELLHKIRRFFRLDA